MSATSVELDSPAQPQILVNGKLIFLAASFLASFGLLYGEVVVGLVRSWSVDDNYTHGFGVVPLALYFAWERRHRFLNTTAHPSPWGLVGVLASLCLLAVGVLGTEYFTSRISIIGAVAGSLLFLHGWRRLRVMAFPIGFLLLMIPIPEIVFNQIALPLQFAASSFAEQCLSLLRIPVWREGNVIHLARTTLEVEEACSGIRSLVSLLTLGIVYGYFTDPRGWIRLVLALSTLPIAILTNALRVAGTGAAAHRFGPQVAEGFLHTFSGWFVFITACLMLALLQGAIVWLVPEKASTR